MSRIHRSLVALAILSASTAHGAIVTLSTANAIGTSGFNAATGWSNAAAPSAGNDYSVSVSFLRSPGAGGSYTFGGDSLTLNTGGGILSKNAGAQTLNSNLILNGGFVRSGSGVPDPLTLAGTIHVSSSGGGLVPDQSPFIVDAAVSGTGTLIVSNNAADLGGAASGPGRGITFNGTNTFTGNMTASATGIVLSNLSTWAFDIGASGVNNVIVGTGSIAVNGIFTLNLTSAGTNLGDSWDLVTVTTESYGSSFAVSGFTDIGSNLWSKPISPALAYQFDRTNGVLSVVVAPVPEPSGVVLSALGLLGLLRRRR